MRLLFTIALLQCVAITFAQEEESKSNFFTHLLFTSFQFLNFSGHLIYIATDGTLFPCYFPVGIWGYSDDSRDDFPRNHLFPFKTKPYTKDI